MKATNIVEPVLVCDESTRHLCATYLCGGFDKAKNWYPGASHFFRGKRQVALQGWCIEAELGDRDCWEIFRCMVQYILSAGVFKFRYTTYEFRVTEFDKITLDALTWEVLGQINEW